MRHHSLPTRTKRDAMSEGGSGMENCNRGRILIVRHAQSAANAGGRTADQATIPITDTGRRQAQCLADFVSERPSLIAVSHYLRTIQTAEPLSRRYPDVPVESWRVEEFTYLDAAACSGTTYAERQHRRDAYWERCEPLWVDGPGCESFAGFVERVRRFEQTLNSRSPDETVVVFTHGFVMRALRWLQQTAAALITHAEMADFYRSQQSVSVPNCAVIRALPNGIGRLQLSADVPVVHLPAEPRTE